MSTILLSGGGSAGHLTPAIAIAEALKKKDPAVKTVFVCADREDETSLLKAAGFTYHTVRAGKFPRGFSVRMLTFPVLGIVALIESVLLLRSVRPDIVFSKGGYVSVPVCLAAFIMRIPVVLHASDSVPSLSDRCIGSIAIRICTGFPVDSWPQKLREKIIVTGNPVREMIMTGSRAAAQRITTFSGRRPVLMVIGGSQGSRTINRVVEAAFDELLEVADVIHLTGAKKEIQKSHARYWSRPYVTEELPHLYAIADVVVTRAGAGVLAELAALKKPCVVVPLEGVAHDHQVYNADVLAAMGAAEVVREARIDTLLATVRLLLASKERQSKISAALHTLFPLDAAQTIAQVTLDVLHITPIQS